jgi:hypothetical protein
MKLEPQMTPADVGDGPMDITIGKAAAKPASSPTSSRRALGRDGHDRRTVSDAEAWEVMVDEAPSPRVDFHL